jgi:hypothetical protein
MWICSPRKVEAINNDQEGGVGSRQMWTGRSPGLSGSYLVNDFQYLNFFHFRISQASAKCIPGQYGVAGVTVAKQASGTIGVWVPISIDTNIPKI